MTAGHLLLTLMIGFTITVGFAVLFNVPRHLLISCGALGAAGHLLRFMLKETGAAPEVSAFSGALLVGLLGYWQARRINMPRLVFTITGIIAMVPGVPAYEMLMFFRNNNVIEGLQSGFRVAMITGGIAAGLSAARALTEIEWRGSGEEEI